MICAAALVLLLDASGSVSGPDWRAQLHGTAEALASGPVTRIIERGGPVAVTALAFSDTTHPLLPWVVITGHADALQAALTLGMQPRALHGGTRLGEAVADALTALDAAPCAAEREVIDISSDGEAPAVPAHAARAAAAERGVTINAIGIGRHAGGTPAEWLRDNAITPGGFSIAAESWADFGQAMRRKLAMELAAR